ncbi:ead/Ea22-like family protein [Klebsiella pneumoniae]|uniref:ead/Ea22-like family protein n=1 Tax=Klebsiella pneumoniae TaxID=573 RepID=UPI00164C5EBE|nr:ead/Ea22-like family protein [Klebsiella pneumoniae]MBC4941884.1 ead/Ea22-like family protein [Klebsiella pneumoniae]WKX35469.1 ead/Ea22-like family protein [Klebsiella pneumoniae subsp. pneumoniae]HCE4066723.1 ead/Ea22-like family protein [Klebsiella pneumoniae]HDE1406137.1 ead/Ea22-like family protein [Klebsiella pneumoniae]
MTDITELAQSLKAAVEKATQGNWRAFQYHDGRCGIGGGHNDEIMVCEHISKERPHDAMFIALANPANVLALVEALEKAQQRIVELDRKNCELDSLTQRWAVERAENADRIAELESRTVKLPAELYTIGELIRTQDNRITDQPMFVVFRKREIIGSDEHSPSRICWVWDGEEVSELRAKRLEALYQDGRDTRGYDRYAMQEVDEFVTACFTEHGCKEYLRQNGHNLRLPYIYACGSFRNNEYQLVRNWLAGIKVEAE